MAYIPGEKLNAWSAEDWGASTKPKIDELRQTWDQGTQAASQALTQLPGMDRFGPFQPKQEEPEWKLPELESFGSFGDKPQPQTSLLLGGTAYTGGGGGGGGEIENYIRQAAAKRGIDPDVAVRVAMSEGGVTEPNRAGDATRGGSYGPFQLNYLPGSVGDQFTKATGLHAKDPNAWQAGVDFALDTAEKSGWSQWFGAARAGIGDRQGIGGTPLPQGGQSTSSSFASLTPDQFGSGLSSEDAYAACGPAAAIAFARKNGRNPTMAEAVNLAKQVGWTPGQGMAGPASQVQLLEKMGVAAKLEGVDGAKIAADVQRGNPVIIDTPGHYFVAERYDAASGKFDWGNSARSLKASGGNTWYSVDELARLGMGAPRNAVYLDSPESPSPSVVAGASPRPVAPPVPGADGTGSGSAGADSAAGQIGAAPGGLARPTGLNLQALGRLDEVAPMPTVQPGLEPGDFEIPGRPVEPAYGGPDMATVQDLGSPAQDAGSGGVPFSAPVEPAPADDPWQGVTDALKRAVGSMGQANQGAVGALNQAGAPLTARHEAARAETDTYMQRLRDQEAMQGIESRSMGPTLTPEGPPIPEPTLQERAGQALDIAGKLNPLDPNFWGRVIPPAAEIANKLADLPADIAADQGGKYFRLLQLDAKKIAQGNQLDPTEQREAMDIAHELGQWFIPTTAMPQLVDRLAGTQSEAVARLGQQGARRPVAAPGVAAGTRGGASTIVSPEAIQKARENLSPVGREVMETYDRLSPERATAAKADVLSRTATRVAEGLPDVERQRVVQVIADTHAAIEANLEHSKVVATGLEGPALRELLVNGRITTKADVPYDRGVALTQQQVGKNRLPSPEQAARFYGHEAESIRGAMGGHRFPDALGIRDEDAPRHLYAHVTDGQPNVSADSPALTIVWKNETPRVTTESWPYALRAPAEGIHASSGSSQTAVKELYRSEGTVRGAQYRRNPDGTVDVVGWDERGVGLPSGRKIMDTDHLVGPDGENTMRANNLVLSMKQWIVSGIRNGSLTDPKEIAARLQMGGSPISGSYAGSAAALNRTRTESLIIDPSLHNIRALVISGPPGLLNRRVPLVPNEATGRTGMTVLDTAKAVRQKILTDTGEDVSIYWHNTKTSGSRLLSDAELIDGPAQPLAVGRGQDIRDRYVAVGLPDIGIVPGTPGETPPGMTALRLGKDTVGGAVAGGYEASQQEGATPESVIVAGATRALAGLGRGVARDIVGVRAPGMGLARITRAANERLRQSGSPELKRLADMADEEIPKVPEGPEIASRVERMRQRVVSALTDENVTLDEIQKRAAKAEGRGLPVEERISAMMRANPDSVTDMQIQNSIMKPLREIGEDRPYASAIMTLYQNVDQADEMGRQAESHFRLPSVPRLEKNLADLTAEAEKLRIQGGNVSVDLSDRIAKAQELVDQAREFVQPSEAKAAADALRAQADDVAQKAADEFKSPARQRLETQVRQLERRVERETAAQSAPNETTVNALDRAKAELAQEQQAESVVRQQIADTERLRVAERAQRAEDQYASPAVVNLQNKLDEAMKRANAEVRAQGRMSATAERRIDAAREALDTERLSEQAAAKQVGETVRDRRMFSGGLNRADSLKALEDLKSTLGPEKYAQAEKVAQSLWDFNQGTRDIAVAGHIWAPDVAEGLAEKYPHYAPTNVIKYTATDGPGGVPNGSKVGLNDIGLKRLTEEGTTAAKQDPIEASVAARYDIARRAQKNVITGEFLDAAKASPEMSPHVREIGVDVPDPKHLTPDQKRITYYDADAVKHEYLVDSWVKPLIESAGKGELNAYQRFLATWRQTVTDRSISFTERNVPRDIAEFSRHMLMAEGGPTPANIARVVKDYATSYREAFKGIRDGTFHGAVEDYLAAGGGFQRASGRGLEEVAQTVDDIARTGGLKIDSPAALYRFATDPISELNKRIELASRSARFRQAERLGESDFGAMIAARDLMPYELGGTFIKTMNRWFPFLNARTQAIATEARLIQRYPKAYLPTTVFAAMLPAFATELWNRADPERAKAYDDVPDYQKYLGHVVMLPWAGKDIYGLPLPNYVMIPLGLTSPYAMLGRVAANATMGKLAAPNDYAEMLAAVTASLSPVDTTSGAIASTLAGPIAGPIIGMMGNKDIFRGSPISTSQSNLEASPLGKAVAGGVNRVAREIPVVGPGVELPPSYVDYAVRAAGYPGQQVLGASKMVGDAVDAMSGKPKLDERQNIQDLPVIGGLVSPLIGNRTGGTFTREADRTMASRAGYELRASEVKWRPPVVDDHIGKVPMTRTERGDVQRQTNALWSEYVANVRQDVPNWDTLDKAEKENLFKIMYSTARSRAEADLVERNPARWKDPEQVRRMTIEQQRKAG